jgi:uncharacterized protein
MTRVFNRTRRTTLARASETARSPWAQFKGLMGRSELPHDSGLVFFVTRGVHTHFMRFPIDVIFFDRNNVVIGVEHALRAWRFSAYHLRAKGAIELPAGTVRATSTEVGDVLCITEASSTNATAAA